MKMLLSFWALLALLSLSLAVPLPASTIGSSEIESKNAALNAFLALILSYLPVLSASIQAVSNVLTDFEELLAFLTQAQTTYNELGRDCTAYTVLFARGTTEPGNVGILVGPPLIDALDALVGSSAVTAQGVNSYKADVAGYLQGGSASGSAKMAQNIQQVYDKCPKTKLVLSGYSQGAQLVHNAVNQLPAAVAGWVSKIILFGDPYNKQIIPNVAASKILNYCHVDDAICHQTNLILPAHLTYALHAPAAARFIAS